MTPEMRRTLTVIQEYYAVHGVSPTFQEMMEALGLKSKAPIHRRVHALVARGHLVKLPGRDRAYAPVETSVNLSAIPTEKLLGELEKRRSDNG